MPAYVKMNMWRMKELTDAAKRALEQTAEAVHTDVVQAQVMPRDTGAMQNESTFVDNSQVSDGLVRLVTSTPYARRLYYHPEYNFSTYENPNARGKWYEDWLAGGTYEDFPINTFKEIYKKEAKV